jgi:formiminotetrahydrofolate cyclodeaminase
VEHPEPPFRDLTLAAFVDRLASAEPVPGGGSASAVAASLAAGLVAMVASLTVGRPRYADHAQLAEHWAEEGRQLATECLTLADDDAMAYAGYSAALKLPRESDEEKAARSEAIRAAAHMAALAPLPAVEACVRIVTGAEALAGRSNANAASDLAVAALLAEAGARGAAANVLVNLPATGDEPFAHELTTRVDTLLGDVERLAAATREVVRSGSPRPAIPPAA